MRIFTLLIGLFLTLPSLASWQLSNDKSEFHFVTTKKIDGSEVHKFTQLNGKISEKGIATLKIDLTSVETNIPIRNERMQQFLFETDLFPQATFTATINQEKIDQLSVGETSTVELTGEINLHGHSQDVSTQVQVVKLTANELMVNSIKPVIIQAKAFNLVAGVEKLKSLAILPSINHSVPVTFSLRYTK